MCFLDIYICAALSIWTCVMFAQVAVRKWLGHIQGRSFFEVQRFWFISLCELVGNTYSTVYLFKDVCQDGGPHIKTISNGNRASSADRPSDQPSNASSTHGLDGPWKTKGPNMSKPFSSEIPWSKVTHVRWSGTQSDPPSYRVMTGRFFRWKESRAGFHRSRTEDAGHLVCNPH